MSQNPGSEIFIGLMSGTSLDGVDIAVIDFAAVPAKTLHIKTVPYPGELRQQLRDLTHSQTTTLDELYGLEARLTLSYAEAVAAAMKQSALTPEKVVALGCHGQTIRHRPDASPPYTAQLCDPGRLAALTGITTVGDFRRKDIALGGQGAPLAPAFHQYLFRTNEEDRAVINIGGIANITFLPADPNQAVIGFDTGPGNTLLDYWIGQDQGLDFDQGGDWARTGRVLGDLLERMLSEEGYFSDLPPKSTGTEYFGPSWLNQWLDPTASAADIQATLLELTASTIGTAVARLPAPVKNCYVCGGGAHNSYLLERLAAILPDVGMQTSSALGIDPDFVEASAFAWLARARLHQQPGNLTEVTAASRPAVLGGIYHAN